MQTNIFNSRCPLETCKLLYVKNDVNDQIFFTPLLKNIKTSHYMLKNISSGRSTHLSSDLTLTFKYDTLGQKVLSEDDI